MGARLANRPQTPGRNHAVSTSPYFNKAFLGTNGRPAASGWFFAYAAGSTVPKAIFSDYSKTIPLSNPLRLDGSGICPQFFTESGLYDFKVFEYNFVTPSEPGPSCFTAEDIDGETGGGGGSPYVLPIATEAVLGGVKPDGVTTFVDEVTGVISSPGTPKPEAVLAVMDFGEPVPANPFVGDKYVANYNQSSPFDAHPNEIATWNGLAWTFRTPSQYEILWNWNSTFYNDIRRGFVIFTGAGWVPCNTQDVVAETVLINQVLMQDFSHPNKYLQIDGGFVFTQKGATPGTVFECPTSGTYVALTSISDEEIAVRGFQGVAPVDKGAYKDFRAQKITASRFQLDTATPDTTPVIGSMHWDDENKTAALHVANGSTVQIGQETVYFVRNNSGVTIGNGKVVYVTGSSGQKCTVALASSGDPAKNSVLAVATQEIANNSDGYVTCVGRVNDIDTSAFADGAELWLSDSVLGGLTAAMPSGGSARVHIGHVIRSHATQGSISVAIERFPYAHELSGSGVTTRTGTSATASGTAITRYTGTGGHTELLPAATTVNGEIRKYRNSGTGLWTLVRAGSDQIDPGNPSALVTSLTLLPGQSVQLYVGAANLWEAL